MHVTTGVSKLNKNIPLCLGYETKKHANICGNVQWNIIHSSGYELQRRVQMLDKTFSGWDPASDTGMLMPVNIRVPNKIENNMSLRK